MISVFTPVHAASAPFLMEAYQSLCDQTYQDFEWVIVVNNGGWVEPAIHLDKRVKVTTSDLKGVGALKRYACGMCSGDYLFEFDADDLLAPTALEECVKAFTNPAVQVAYSNCVEFMDGTWQPAQEYDAIYGWVYKDCEFRGHKLREAVAWPVSAHSMRRILWNVNHFKAFRATAYHQILGHDPKLALGDDQDLLCRFYLRYGANGFKHIDAPLYFYRVHQANTVKTQNAELQTQMNLLYLKFIEPLFLRWARDEKLRCVDLGGRINRSPHKQYETVDLFGADLNFDLNGRWYLADNSIGVCRMSHVLEHLASPIHAMNEAYRVLAPGGLLMLEVPSIVGVDGKSVGLGSVRDPTHLHYFCYQSIWYYTRQQYASFIQPQYQGRFQESRIETWELEPHVPVVTSELIALKGGPYEERHAGEVMI